MAQEKRERDEKEAEEDWSIMEWEFVTDVHTETLTTRLKHSRTIDIFSLVFKLIFFFNADCPE
jgi:hypothetical protein